jgi:hypothetical protein
MSDILLFGRIASTALQKKVQTKLRLRPPAQNHRMPRTSFPGGVYMVASGLPPYLPVKNLCSSLLASLRDRFG